MKVVYALVCAVLSAVWYRMLFGGEPIDAIVAGIAMGILFLALPDPRPRL